MIKFIHYVKIKKILSDEENLSEEDLSAVEREEEGEAEEIEETTKTI